MTATTPRAPMPWRRPCTRRRDRPTRSWWRQGPHGPGGAPALARACSFQTLACGAHLCRAAMEASSVNVYVNTASMRDRVYARRDGARVRGALSEWVPRARGCRRHATGVMKGVLWLSFLGARRSPARSSSSSADAPMRSRPSASRPRLPSCAWGAPRRPLLRARAAQALRARRHSRRVVLGEAARRRTFCLQSRMSTPTRPRTAASCSGRFRPTWTSASPRPSLSRPRTWTA